MLKYIIRRILQLIPVIVGISILVFMLVHLAPGDPIRLLLGEEATPEDYARLNRIYGFDRPLPVQYFSWASNAVRGDFGESIRQGVPVTGLIASRLPATMELAFFSVLFAVMFGVPLGVLAAIKRGSAIDLSSMVLALVGVSMPGFWLGLVLLSYIALNVGWLPMFGRGGSVFYGLGRLFTTFSAADLFDGFRYILLPALSIGTAMMAIITRLTRSSLLEVLGKDYIRTARAKGLGQRVVVFKHGLRNALLPVVTIVGIQFGVMLGGAVITETVFAWPGVGRLIVNAISQRDFPIIQAGVLMLAVIFTMVNLTVDLSYALLNPRIRYD